MALTLTLHVTPKNFLEWYKLFNGIQGQDPRAAREVLRLRDRVLHMEGQGELKAFFERVAIPCVAVLAEDTRVQVGEFLSAVTCYYDLKVPVKDKYETLKRMAQQCEWIRTLPDERITFCTPAALNILAKRQGRICAQQLFVLALKAHLFALSIVTCVLGAMLSVVPIGAVVTPLLMGISLLSMIGYLFVEFVVQKVVDLKQESIIKTQLLMCQRFLSKFAQ